MHRRIKFNENQLALPFGERRGVSISLETKQKAFWFLVSVCLFSLVLYIYAINATAHHIAVRQHLEGEATAAATNLSSLEFAYIELSNAVTIDVAAKHGFTEVKKPLYVSRDSDDSLTLNTVKR